MIGVRGPLVLYFGALNITTYTCKTHLTETRILPHSQLRRSFTMAIRTLWPRRHLPTTVQESNPLPALRHTTTRITVFQTLSVKTSRRQAGGSIPEAPGSTRQTP